MSGSTYSTILRNLDSDTVYTVSVVPVYAAGEGLRMSENGKTCKHCTHATAAVGNEINCRREVVRQRQRPGTSVSSGFRKAHADQEVNL